MTLAPCDLCAAPNRVSAMLGLAGAKAGALALAFCDRANEGFEPLAA